MKATMKDVAALANVGVGTVSRVINGVRVKESTREKVQSAIDTLNYVPDEYARGMKTNKTNTVAIILPTIWHPFFSEFTYYVEEYLSTKNYKLFLCNSESNPEKEKEYIEMVKQTKVDGIIAITYSDIDKYISSDLPFVSIDRHFSEKVSYVSANNFQGGQVAAEELIQRNCKHLCYIGGKNQHPNETNNRKDGFQQYCENKGFDVTSLVLEEPIQNLDQQLLDFFEKHDDIDGIMAVNDLMALNIIRILNHFGKKAPEDYQLIGFDGAEISEGHPLAVSTIVQPLKEMAMCSVDALFNLLENKNNTQRAILPVTFREGLTTKKTIDN